MDVYVVWNSAYHCYQLPYVGDNDDIIGVFIDELNAYKIACHEQIEKYNKNDIDRLTIWLIDHTFPSNDDLSTWKDYLDLLTSHETITEINDGMLLKECQIDVIHVTKKQLDVFLIPGTL